MLITSLSRSTRTSPPRAAVAAAQSGMQWAGLTCLGRHSRWRHSVALQLGDDGSFDRRGGVTPPPLSRCPTFAGVAFALTEGLYERAGLELSVPPRCPWELVPQRVRDLTTTTGGEATCSSSSTVVVGRADQRSLVRAALLLPPRSPDRDGNGFGLTAVAATFRRSGLCLASLPGSSSSKLTLRRRPPPPDPHHPKGGDGVTDDSAKIVVAAESDEEAAFLRRILPSSTYMVVARPRDSWAGVLSSGDVDAVLSSPVDPAHHSLALELGCSEEELVTRRLDGITGGGGAKLGYGGVFFVTDGALRSDGGGDVLSSFLDATYRGWEMVVRDGADEAVGRMEDAAAMLGSRMDSTGGGEVAERGRLSPPHAAVRAGVSAAADLVTETFEGDRLGFISTKRWREATRWLVRNVDVSSSGAGTGTAAAAKAVDDNLVLRNDLWKPPPHIMAGDELARTTLEKAAASARSFRDAFGRRPSLAVITVGDVPPAGGDDAERSGNGGVCCWFHKTRVGEANGFDVTEIRLGHTTTTDELVGQIRALRHVDGLHLTSAPLPAHITLERIYDAVDVPRDVGGVHYAGLRDLGSFRASMPPPTASAVVVLMDKHRVDLRDKFILVVGGDGGDVFGSAALSSMLGERGGTVAVSPPNFDPKRMEGLVRMADVVVSCLGGGGDGGEGARRTMIPTSWIKPGAVVIDASAAAPAPRRETDSSSLDLHFDGDLSSVEGVTFSPFGSGVGPLGEALLFKHVASAAWGRMKGGDAGVEESGWERTGGRLSRSFHFDEHGRALDFVKKVHDITDGGGGDGTWMDCCRHHPPANVKLSPHGDGTEGGVDVTLEFTTPEVNDVTERDYDAARAVNVIVESGAIRMSDYTYHLDPQSIAKYPAEPRGTSRLVRVDRDGEVTFHDDFSQCFPDLARGAHVVLNDSRVVNARLRVSPTDGGRHLELMILDIGGGEAATTRCNGMLLKVMLRTGGIRPGDVFVETTRGSARFHVVTVDGIWEEDEDSDGDGTECTVRCIVEDDGVTLRDLLGEVGTVPIPPYLHRESEPGDAEAYNNVYAADDGASVAAPTAGLHFTEEILGEIGEENLSYLSLHVGAGTFKPVTAADARDHRMHAERFSVNVGELRRIISALERGERLIVVGTTTARTLESLYWCGVKRFRNMQSTSRDEDDREFVLGQHEWAQLSSFAGDEGAGGKMLSAIESLRLVVSGRRDDDFVSGCTSLMIAPRAYEFKVVDELVTNFHAPDSTLMLLVSAFLGSGDKVRKVYHDAQKRGYKFLSYGDVCLFSRPGSK